MRMKSPHHRGKGLPVRAARMLRTGGKTAVHPMRAEEPIGRVMKSAGSPTRTTSRNRRRK